MQLTFRTNDEIAIIGFEENSHIFRNLIEAMHSPTEHRNICGPITAKMEGEKLSTDFRNSGANAQKNWVKMLLSTETMELAFQFYSGKTEKPDHETRHVAKSISPGLIRKWQWQIEGWLSFSYKPLE